MLEVAPGLVIPKREFTFQFARSGGPGGQNVNKVNTKAVLRWNVVESPSLPGAVRHRFLSRYKNRINDDGELVLSSERYRSQSRNCEDCLEKVREMVAAVRLPPKVRRKTKPTRAAKARRMDSKKRQSQKKQSRRRPGMDD